MRSRLAALITVILCATPAAAYYDYEHIPQLFTTGSLVEVAWHPDGDYALVIEGEGKVFRVEASDWSMSQVDDLANMSLWHIDFHPDGTEALIVGRYLSGNTDEGRVYRYDHGSGNVELLTDLSETGIELRAVAYVPDGTSAVIVGWVQTGGAGGILYAWDYDPADNTKTLGGANNFWGPSDVSWRPDAQEALITISQNDAEVVAYRPPAPYENRLLSTDYYPNGSNAAAVDHHPQLSFGLVVDWAQNALKYDGVWTKVDLPGSSLAGLSFNADGSRALLVGRARSVSGSLVGTVMEYTGSAGSFTIDDFRDVSIPGFGSAPWQGDGNTYLHAVAFRPGLCEGLMVGSHSVFSSKFAPIAHFVDFRGADCLSSEEDGGVDAGMDAGVDAGVDAGFDAGADEGTDAGHDAGADEGFDAGVDAGFDAGHDAGEDADGGGSTTIPCSEDTQCPAGMYCNGDHCVQDCASDSDCMAPFVCDGRGRCVLPDQDGGVDAGVAPDGTGPLDGADAGPGDISSCLPCRFDSECPAGRYCKDGCCVTDCYIDTECPRGFYCGERGRCVAGAEEVTGCACGTHAARTSLPWLLMLLAGFYFSRNSSRKRTMTRPR